jgi:hypothetical protein
VSSCWNFLELIHDALTDEHKISLIVSFSNFVNASFAVLSDTVFCCRCAGSSVISGLVCDTAIYLSNRLRLNGYMYCVLLSDTKLYVCTVR